MKPNHYAQHAIATLTRLYHYTQKWFESLRGSTLTFLGVREGYTEYSFAWIPATQSRGNRDALQLRRRSIVQGEYDEHLY